MTDIEAIRADLDDIHRTWIEGHEFLIGAEAEIAGLHQAAHNLLTVIDRVRALHVPHPDYPSTCLECGRANPEDGSGQDYPCPTIKALDGDA